MKRVLGLFIKKGSLHYAEQVTQLEHALQTVADAKWHICTIDKSYFDTLSAASKHSLILQGGTMNLNEMALFQANPWHQDAITLRDYDDAGKTLGLSNKNVEIYEALLTQVTHKSAG